MNKSEMLQSLAGVKGFREGYSKGTTKKERIRLGLKTAASQIVAPWAYQDKIGLATPPEEGRWRIEEADDETQGFMKAKKIIEPIFTAGAITGASALAATDHVLLAAGVAALEIGHRLIASKPLESPTYYDAPGDFSIDQYACAGMGQCVIAQDYLGKVDIGDGMPKTYIKEQQPEDERGKKRMVAALQSCPVNAIYFRGSYRGNPDMEPHYSSKTLTEDIDRENENEYRAQHVILSQNISALLRKRRQEAK